MFCNLLKTKMKNFLLLLFFSILLSSCNKKKPINDIESQVSLSFLKTYKAKSFLDDQRLEKIKEVKSEIKSLFDTHFKDNNIPGISYGIVVDDSLIISSSVGVSNIHKNIEVSTNTSFRIASMSKSFTALAILMLRDEGKLSLKDPVVNYIPELKSLNYLTKDSPILNIENLLTMTTGFPEDNPWGDRQLSMTKKDFVDFISGGVSMSKTPSYQYEYSNTGYAMLGYVIGVVSGVSYQDYIKNKILIPLGMYDTHWEYSTIEEEKLALGYRWEDENWRLEPMLHDGIYGAMGGLITTIKDFSKYVSFHLNAWPIRNDDNNGIVKRSTIREMHVPKYNFLNSWKRDWDNKPCAGMIGYGYGLGISMDCKRIKKVAHGGALPGFGSDYAFFPEYGIGIMAFGNKTYTSPMPSDKLEKLLFETLDLQGRKLPPSEILIQRKEQITNLITTENVNLVSDIFAENFFLDDTIEDRLMEIQRIRRVAGRVIKIHGISAKNQLRGDFIIQCENGDIKVFFTLSPEKVPLVQKMNVSFNANKKVMN